MDIKRRLKKVERNMKIDKQEEGNKVFLNTATDFGKYMWEIRCNPSKYKDKEIICSPWVERIIEEFLEKGRKWDEMQKGRGMKTEETEYK
jgi:hypothetical protein